MFLLWIAGFLAAVICVTNPIPPMTNVERGAYIKQYIDTYGDPLRDWSLYDIHHIQPREYEAPTLLIILCQS
ncbi:hypothetical protein SAMN05443252_105164 [Bacillus sp. OV322]|nr:hypothetical protein SAMN05443252_105164 [Bacillus sp. OV322]